MKRIGLRAVGIGVLGSVVLLTAGQVFAQNDGAPKCTPATLKGRYLFSAPAVVFPPVFGVTEVSVGNAAGIGTGHDYVSVTINGVVFPVPSPAGWPNREAAS